MDVQDFWDTNLIYKVVAGSQAYGLATGESDYDTRGICIPPKEYWLGISEFEQKEITGDVIIYSIKKFCRLALDCNPNIIELLFTDERNVLYINRYGQILRDNRHLFLSRKARFTFSGYAISQLKRIQTHYKWLKNPPDHQPLQEEFGARFENEHWKWPSHHEENAYKAALKHWQQYKIWRENRNPKRAALEEKYGYDTKHAMHLVRLMRMGEEILTTGEVRVFRPDREELKEIREGKLSYEGILSLSQEYDLKMEKLYLESKLPHSPQRKKVEALLVEIVEDFLR